jgi:hypothetical protein
MIKAPSTRRIAALASRLCSAVTGIIFVHHVTSHWQLVTALSLGMHLGSELTFRRPLKFLLTRRSGPSWSGGMAISAAIIVWVLLAHGVEGSVFDQTVWIYSCWLSIIYAGARLGCVLLGCCQTATFRSLRLLEFLITGMSVSFIVLLPISEHAMTIEALYLLGLHATLRLGRAFIGADRELWARTLFKDHAWQTCLGLCAGILLFHSRLAS